MIQLCCQKDSIETIAYLFICSLELLSVPSIHIHFSQSIAVYAKPFSGCSHYLHPSRVIPFYSNMLCLQSLSLTFVVSAVTNHFSFDVLYRSSKH
ncbi:hypothetical protein EDC96DRAFT_527575 [Choanephora cucurbitarum]|nr:hypothetical protein EDC96DRAFT_527575 [Choanephora cucurbitarum]